MRPAGGNGGRPRPEAGEVPLPAPGRKRQPCDRRGGRAGRPRGGGESLPESEPESGEPAGKYPCPCCGYLTFPVPKEEALAYICPVCFWENDLFDPGEDDPSDENHGMTLCQGRENYRKYGAVRPDFLRYVRPPRPEEQPVRPEDMD